MLKRSDLDDEDWSRQVAKDERREKREAARAILDEKLDKELARRKAMKAKREQKWKR